MQEGCSSNYFTNADSIGYNVLIVQQTNHHTTTERAYVPNTRSKMIRYAWMSFQNLTGFDIKKENKNKKEEKKKKTRKENLKFW